MIIKRVNRCARGGANDEAAAVPSKQSVRGLPGEKHALNDREVLQQEVALGLGGETGDALSDAQLHRRHQLRRRPLQQQAVTCQDTCHNTA